MSDDLDLTPESQDPFDPTAKDESVKVTGMFQEWFLDYASYVILERAVPAI